MAFKFVILALTLAYANAGNLIAEPEHAVQYSSAPAVSSSYFNQASAPVAHAKTLAVATPQYASAPAYAYQAAPAVHYQPQAVAYQSAPQAIAYQAAPQHVAVHAPSVGLSQQAVSRSLGGAQSVSTYSKAVDSAFSSVRKYDTRITNDGVSYAPAQLAYSAPLVTKAYAAPSVQYTAQAPVAYAAQPSIAYSHAPVVTKTYAAPQVYSYGAPIAKAVAPVATYATAHAPVHYAAAPAVSYGAPAPIVAKAAVSYGPAVAHTTFQGYGVEYHY